jgi:hypothetical protein
MYVCNTSIAKMRVTIMSVQLIEAELLEELSTEEQEFLSGGQLYLPANLRGFLRDKEGKKYPVRLSILEPSQTS